jgi:geranylgeranyl pyrophosphate synthase
LIDKQVLSLIQLINDNWISSSAWPDFIEAMRLLIPEEGIERDQNVRWAKLPGLCCQAAGGEFQLANEVSAAWLLLHLAGHLIDSVEDGDKVKEIDVIGGPGSAINLANGYFLSAALMLNGLSKNPLPPIQTQQIRADFYNTILVMTSGQHQDINGSQLSLKQWWRVAEAKTGSFFSLACRSGARLGSGDLKKIASFGDYGFQLGLMLQIHDDVEELQLLMTEGSTEVPKNLHKSLAFTYAVDMLPGPEKIQLNDLIGSISNNPDKIKEIIEYLDKCGAGLYLLTELERHYNMGVKSLQDAAPQSPAFEDLMEIIGGLKFE